MKKYCLIVCIFITVCKTPCVCVDAHFSARRVSAIEVFVDVRKMCICYIKPGAEREKSGER